MKKILLAILTLILALAVIVPACSSSTSDNTTAFCNSLQNLAVAYANVKNLNATTTVDQAKQSINQLQSAWDATVSAKGNLNASKFSDLQNSYNQLKSSLGGLSGSQTVAQAWPTVQAAFTSFQANLDAVRTTTCHFTPTATSSP